MYMFYTRYFYDVLFILHLKHVLYLVQNQKNFEEILN